jgi:hypothetical protein
VDFCSSDVKKCWYLILYLAYCGQLSGFLVNCVTSEGIHELKQIEKQSFTLLHIAVQANYGRKSDKDLQFSCFKKVVNGENSLKDFGFNSITYLLTYLVTPWSTVLLEKLTGSQLVKKFPAFYATRRFITAFTSVHDLSLS